MLVNVNIFPIGKGISISSYVAVAVDEVQKCGLDYRLTSMGTIIEGDWDEVMKVVRKMRDKVLKLSDRVYMTISIDDRNDRRRHIEEKVKRVEHILAKTLKK